MNPKLLSKMYLNGNHEFNRNPMAPPGTKIITHTKPANRQSWTYHGQLGWYIRPVSNHYRCVKCYLPKTRSEIFSDTIKFIPKYFPIPTLNIDDHVRQSFHTLISLLQNKKMLFPGINNHLDTTSNLLTLTKCLQNRATLPGLETPSHNKIKPIPHISPKNLGTPKTTSKCEKE